MGRRLTYSQRRARERQREALAQAVGLTVDQATKLVNKQEEAVTLAGKLAGQQRLAGKRAAPLPSRSAL